MRELVTSGDICLKDEYNLVYKIAEITYREREDESFIYEIRPNYSVISLLKVTDFQGIPGLDLDLRKEVYIRENIVPVFISERAPSKNREDLWDLLEECGMQYLNQLEWLIDIDSIRQLGNRSAVICHKLLDTICYGNDVRAESIIIDDKNRRQYFDLLTALYSTERKYLNSQRNTGIQSSIRQGKFKGRTRIKIDKLAEMEIFTDYENKKINSAEAAHMLGISTSTFFRRYKEYKNHVNML